MSRLDIDVDEVKRLVELVEKHGLDELTVEEGDLSVTVKSRSTAPAAAAVVQNAEQIVPLSDEMVLVEPSVNEQHVEGAQEEEGIFNITAPIVGVFYRAPAPDAPPFVEVGDFIEVGTEVGLIEAMKAFSPIPSEVAGEVIEIPAENGKLVQQGDVLVRVRVKAT